MPIGPGSQQLRLFRRAIRSGATLEEACAATGNIIGPVEGRIYIESDRKDPPPEEAFELLYDPDAPAAASQPKEAAMAGRRMAREKSEEQAQEIPQKDFAEAVKIYRNDIRPATTKQAEHAQEASTGYKAVKKNCHIQPQAAKTAFKLWFNTEDAQRDDWLRSFVGLINEAAGYELLTFHGDDLVDRSERQTERPMPRLVTLEDDEDEFEASDEELAAQRDRPSVEQAQAEADAASEEEPASGTGAAARRAMSKRQEEVPAEAAE